MYMLTLASESMALNIKILKYNMLTPVNFTIYITFTCHDMQLLDNVASI